MVEWAEWRFHVQRINQHGHVDDIFEEVFDYDPGFKIEQLEEKIKELLERISEHECPTCGTAAWDPVEKFCYKCPPAKPPVVPKPVVPKPVDPKNPACPWCGTAARVATRLLNGDVARYYCAACDLGFTQDGERRR